MKKLNKEELLKTSGGAKFSITGSIVSATVSLLKFVYSMGQECGSSLRRIYSDKMCALK